MEVTASHRFASVSTRKVRLVLWHLPGQPIGAALNLLKFLPTPHAKIVAKIVKAAASNAENNYSMDPDMLYIKRAIANEGRYLKRARPQSRGRYSPYQKRTSHITIVVDEREK
jgi:large subunit ribosomal protein L22